MDFRFETHSASVHFGREAAALLPKHLASYGRVMVIAGPRYRHLTAQLCEALGPDRIVRFEKVAQHVPQELVDEAAGVVRQTRPDAILAVGGGSAIGLAKALALGASPGLKECYFEDGLAAPEIIAVPSTFSGSEQTDIWGITTVEGKKTGKSELVLPRVVIYDPELLSTLPSEYAAASAMNAMAHLVEAVYAPDGNPVTRFQALQGIETVAEGLRRLSAVDSDTLPVEIAEKLLLGAFLGGKSLREVSMALQHKSAHVIGGLFGADHAKAHAVLLPHVLHYQWPHLDRDIRADLKQVLGPYPPQTLQELAANAGVPTDLQRLGVKKTDLSTAADRIQANPYPNPAPLDRFRLLTMLENAWSGTLQAEQQFQ